MSLIRLTVVSCVVYMLDEIQRPNMSDVCFMTLPHVAVHIESTLADALQCAELKNVLDLEHDSSSKASQNVDKRVVALAIRLNKIQSKLAEIKMRVSNMEVRVISSRCFTIVLVSSHSVCAL